ncbi:uncharacterized protein PAC_12909 [Phialocephala subalpina]|uniref:Uncharacterized protein n=1 Tax=Phialocephala subalpina TaxID=576137 RepID=A0A1L7XDB4_9HELO|nr:uncharacterized protein PAC_12909 [Phialocephala subalpina]
MNSPSKRAVSTSAENSSPSKRKHNRSDESTQSTETQHTESTNITSPSAYSTSSVEKMDIDSVREDTEYYAGLSGNLKLLARGNKPKQQRPMISDPYGNPGVVPAPKNAYIVGKHIISEKLKNGLRKEMVDILEAMKPADWISFDFLRLGYSKVEKENPVVVFVTVNYGEISREEGQRVVRELEDACIRYDLNDVEVEMVEGRRMLSAGVGDVAELLPDQQGKIPLVGASIAVSREHIEFKTGCGTLGGYVMVDGITYGLTNHHVCLGPHRYSAFPSESEEGKIVWISQPAAKDFEDTMKSLETTLAALKKRKVPDQANITVFENRIRRLQELKSNGLNIGYIYKTSGIRVRDPVPGEDREKPYKLDWALIKMENSTRIPSQGDLVNEVPSYALLRETNVPQYVTAAGLEEGVGSLTSEELPEYLKRGLSYEEIHNKQSAAENKYAKYVVWKCGRTSHFTYGLSMDIHSSVKWTDEDKLNPLISEEWGIKDSIPDGASSFSKNGDSGSFVWDTDGYVAGLCWGGKFETFLTYVTPMEIVLEDIKKVCGAQEVRLVAMPGDDTVFGKPAQKSVSDADLKADDGLEAAFGNFGAVDNEATDVDEAI